MRGYPLLVLALASALTLAATAPATPSLAAVAVAVDLSHGQGVEGLDVIVGSCPNCYWVVVLQSQEQEANIPPEILGLFDEVRYGGFTRDTLAGVSVLLIGQPTVLLSDQELEALTQWWAEGGKAVWVAGDSDYPAQGSEVAQQAVNQVAEAVGSVIRSDYVSIEDPVSNAGRPYRVVAIVDPEEPLTFLARNLEYGKVLFHGPGALYVLTEEGPVNPLKNPEAKPDNVYVIVRTTDRSYAVEHQTLENAGFPAELYDPLDDELGTGPFPFMMAEIMYEVGGLFIASSETMYGGYEPMTAASYYDVPLDGPVFVPNIINFMVGFVTGQFVVVEETVTVTETVTTTQVQTETVTQTVTQTTTVIQQQGGGNAMVIAAAALILAAGIAVAAFILRR